MASAAVEPRAADDQVAPGAFDALHETGVGLAARRIHDEPHGFTRLERRLRPAARFCPLERWTFTAPFFRRSIRASHGKRDPGVRAAPSPLADGPLHRHFAADVVVSGAVVSLDRRDHHEDDQER